DAEELLLVPVEYQAAAHVDERMLEDKLPELPGLRVVLVDRGFVASLGGRHVQRRVVGIKCDWRQPRSVARAPCRFALEKLLELSFRAVAVPDRSRARRLFLARLAHCDARHVVPVE